MMSPCETILERLATGEPLTDDQSAHVTRCVDCARLARVPTLLATAAREPEPSPGFSSRMQIGGRNRFHARRRNRVVLTSLAAMSTVAVLAIAFTRTDPQRAEPGAMHSLADQEREPRPPPVAERAATSTEELALDLVRVADVDAALGAHADWPEITKPLQPYRTLLDREGARKGARR